MNNQPNKQGSSIPGAKPGQTHPAQTPGQANKSDPANKDGVKKPDAAESNKDKGEKDPHEQSSNARN